MRKYSRTYNVSENMEIYETQPERTDLPLVVMPVIIESMVEPFEKELRTAQRHCPRAHVQGFHA